ncbi:MAG: DUF4494 family protein [Bacteroidaceae bacterium]|nr:DUF4494 family protein [Bacteroidaceae bacterium]
MNFEVKVKVGRLQADGTTKAVSELYLVKAESFSEAEKMMCEELSTEGVEFIVTAVKIAKYETIITVKEDDADKYFKAKADLITINERTGKEKHSKFSLLIRATDINLAKAYFGAYTSKGMAETLLIGIEETKIIGIIEAE